MNYTTGECICEKPTGSVPTNQIVVPPLREQIGFLADKAQKCFYSVNRLAYFMGGMEMEEECIDGKTATAMLSYVVRTLDAITLKADALSEYFH